MKIDNLVENDGLDTLEPFTDKIALIDADTIAYTSCLYCEAREELLPESFYTNSEWKEIEEHPGFHEDTWSIYTIDLEDAFTEAQKRVEEIRYKTKTKAVELYFSSGKTFRHHLKDTYKQNRIKLRYPEGLEWLKSELIKEYDGAICDGWEADDQVVYLKRRNSEKYVLCAIDKDVLYSLPGMHFDYYHNRMEWKEVDIQTATKWPYLQTLMGDSADNIPGLKGIGIKTAEKILAEAVLPCDCWEAVVEAYQKKGETIKHAIETMRLVNLHQLVESRNKKLSIQLWEPPCNIKEKE